MRSQLQRKLKVGCRGGVGFFVLVAFFFLKSKIAHTAVLALMSDCLFVKLGVELLNLYYINI